MPRQLVLRIDRMPYTPNTHSFWISLFFISRKFSLLVLLGLCAHNSGFRNSCCYPKAKEEDEEEFENKGGRTKLIYTPMAQELAVLPEYCSHARLLL